MLSTAQSRSRIALPIDRAIAWGMLGGLAATLVMDLVLIAILGAAGMSPFTCFSIVGDTLASVLSLPGITTASSILLGAAAHYLIGPLLGAGFGAAAAFAEGKAGAKGKILRVEVLSRGGPKKTILYAILYAEIVSQPLVALAPIFLRMTASDTLLWFGGAFGMHLIWGCILGIVLYNTSVRTFQTNRNHQGSFYERLPD